MSVLRNLFSLMLLLSAAVHAGVAIYCESAGDALPTPIAPERGMWSVELAASIQSTSGDLPPACLPEIESEALVPETERQPVTPQVVETIPERIEQPPDSSFPVPIARLSPPTESPLTDVVPPATAVKAIERPLERTPLPRVRPETNDTAEMKETAQPNSRDRTGSVASDPSLGSKASQGTDSDESPRTRVNPTPTYPADALQAGRQGRVTLRVTVESDGTVSAVRVHESSGTSSLDQAASEGVRKWQFHPGRRAGAATAMDVEVPVRFVIRDR